MKFHQLSSSFILQYFRKIDTSLSYYFQNFQMIQIIASSIVLFFVSNISPKLYILLILIHQINLQFFSQIFYLHLLVTIVILKGEIGTILIL